MTPGPAALTYRLLRSPVAAAPAIRLDSAQQAVVDHRGGPLLVLAGPGTGKTTTLVEAVVDRVERGGPDRAPVDPGRVLILTFGRKAAEELRSRVTARLGRTTSEAMAWTFHGFCYALLRRYQDAAGFADPLRLLSGPEQHAVVRELLAGAAELGGSRWPRDLQGLARRRGFVEEVRRLLARVRQLGLDPADLAELAGSAGRPDWAAAAAFCEEYLDVLTLRGVIDYGELVRSAAALAARPDIRAQLRGAYDVVLVDEYQDTDPAQEQLLRELAGDGRDLVVVGDPDQSIYAFRGADVSNLLDFPQRFRTASGEPAPVKVLQTSRRSSGALLVASRAVATRIPLPGLPAESVRRHRDLVVPPAAVSPSADRSEPPPSAVVEQLSLLAPSDRQSRAPDGSPAAAAASTTAPMPAVSVLLFPTAGREVEAIADVLRRAHLEDGLPWSSMAVLVRSGTRTIPTLRRALVTGGVPVDVAGDELPLVREPAVRTLLLALAAAVVPGRLTAEAVRDLLGSPLVSTSPARLRRLGRALRALDRVRVAEDGTPPRPSGELLLSATLDPSVLADVPTAVARPLVLLRALLDRVATVHDEGGTVEDALWALWSATPWPRRLEGSSYRGGAAGRRADADLDAVVALFDIAARAEERLGHVGVADFVEQVQAQQIPADTLAEQPVQAETVRLLTAHRAKGLEWDLVVVAGVQEEVWPDLRRRDSLLGAERVGRFQDGGAVATPPAGAATVVAEERRLFYVAVTRARRRLVVTAVASADDGAERPSRFLAELGMPTNDAPQLLTGRRLTVPDLVAELRARSVDAEADPALRAAAARRLAWLAAARGGDGRPLVAVADPVTWWGVADASDPAAPMRADDEPIRLRGSGIEQLGSCPLQWFLEQEARGGAGRNQAAGFGSLVHAIAEAVTKGTLAPDLDTLAERVDAVWARLEFEIPWHSERERSQARAALARFLEWHGADRGRTVAGAERPITLRLDVAGRPVEIRGRIDRVEVDADGRVWVVDLKTQKTPHTQDRVSEDPQLAVYQMAVRGGALDDVEGVAEPAEPAGAELVYLRSDAPRKATGPKVVRQDALGPPGTHPAEEVLDLAVRRVASEHFPAVVGPRCQYCNFKRSCPADPYGQQVVS